MSSSSKSAACLMYLAEKVRMRLFCTLTFCVATKLSTITLRIQHGLELTVQAAWNGTALGIVAVELHCYALLMQACIHDPRLHYTQPIKASGCFSMPQAAEAHIAADSGTVHA